MKTVAKVANIIFLIYNKSTILFILWVRELRHREAKVIFICPSQTTS